jgi:hypothetical protein
MHQIERCFAGLTDVIENILNLKAPELPHPTGLILASLHRNAKAALALAPDGLLNESYLLMRVAIDAGVTFTYLIESDDAERKSYVAQAPASIYLKSATPQELLLQAKASEALDSVPPHSLKPIRERIDALTSKGVINGDAWLVVVASVFPHSSELLRGGLHAYVPPFLKEDKPGQTRRAGDHLTTLYFLVGEVLCEIIGICSKHVAIPQLNEGAQRLRARLHSLMERATDGIDDPVQGTWGRLEMVEHLGSREISKCLADFEAAFELTYEAAVIAPTLRKATQRAEFRHAALYLRRALNDFRAVWILLARGYTSQAAACAGSLFEASLATACLLRPDKIQEFEAKLNSATGNDFPWKPMHMAKVACAGVGKDINDPNPDFQNAWRSLYARYAWLSKIRHSTFQSVIHDIGSSRMDCGQYVVMAVPNATEEDLPVKLGVAIGAIADLQRAISAVVKALGYGEETGVATFDERMRLAGEKIGELVKRLSEMENPITIQRTEFLRRHPPVPKGN